MDTDGSLGRGYFDYLTKSPQLAEDVLFVARSLGFAAYRAIKTVDSRPFHRIGISGDVSTIPTRIRRKQAPPRRQKKNVLRTGFRVERIPDADYYGFTLDGDGRFLLGDFTVTHNTVLAAHMIERVARDGGRADFICDRESLIRQTSERLAEWDIEHGVAQGANTFGKTRRVQVKSAQTVAARKMTLDADLTVVDEAHIIHTAVQDQLLHNGKHAIALSATPFREGLVQYWEAVVNVETTQRLVNEGWLSRIRPYIGKPVEVGKKTGSGEYDTGDTSASALKIVGDVLQEWEEKTQKHFGGPVKTIAFANRVADAEELARQFREAGHDFHAVSYLDSPEERRWKIEAHRRSDILGLVSVEALQRGYDVPDILCGIGCHPWRKSLTAVAQEIGRTMRRFEGKSTPSG